MFQTNFGQSARCLVKPPSACPRSLFLYLLSPPCN